MRARAVLVSVLALVAAGCFHAGADGGGSSGGARTVPIRVVEGPDGGTLALVEVTLGGSGPFTFAVDTGASRSLVDASVVEEAGLRRTGRARRVRGVIGVDRANLVRIESWRAGEVDLPARTVFSVDLPHPGSDGGIRGLLGSDVLASFGTATVDYEDERLVLGAAGG